MTELLNADYKPNTLKFTLTFSIFSLLLMQVVALPYNTLLHKQTRESCGIRLAGNIVIVDEAHNLAETISNVYSVAISGTQVYS